MNNFNNDRNSRNGGRRSFGGGFASRGYGRNSRDDKQMFDTVCSNCGNACQVPFRPTGEKPVYCSDCFEKMGDRGDRKSFGRPSFGDRKSFGGNSSNNSSELKAISAKLDKILKLLQPAPIAQPEPEAELEPEAEAQPELEPTEAVTTPEENVSEVSE